MNIETRMEGRRGCGYRKPGGIYLVGPPSGRPCCKLPHQLSVCPCCGVGIKPTRGWTWVDADAFFKGECTDHTSTKRPMPPCPLVLGLGRAGLLWIGEQFYPTVQEFNAEANKMGVSRRIHTVPREFKLGETWVMLAHRKVIPYEVDIEGGIMAEAGIQLTKTEWKPAIFSVFKPTALEYIVKGDETEEDLEKLVKRGLTPINVNPRKAFK